MYPQLKTVMRNYFLLFALVTGMSAQAQFLTREDSLNAGLTPNAKAVILAGYGEAKVSYDANFQTAEASLTRNVLFLGYRFSKKITFFSELEVENAKIDGDGGELAMEQCVLKFDINRNHYLLAGLFIPRIGLLNENHLPVTFNGNDRHMVEQMILPATWRELGVGYFGSSNRIPGLNWSAGIMNGLDGTGITGSSGLRNARFEGRNASASNIGTTASLLYFYKGFRFQVSGYYGGTIGMTPTAADSLDLDSGPFGTPVALGEFNIQYRKSGFQFKALASYVMIPEAERLNRAFANNVAETMYGYFVEAGYNLFEKTKWKEKQLVAFSRYEGLDLMASIPENGIRDEQYNQSYIISGLTFLPVRGVAVKFDWKHLVTGEQNPALVFNPSPNAPAYLPVNNFYQLGLAYSF